MALHRMIRQTLFLSGSHFAVRVAGFAMRIWLSRELGAQTMGLVELVQSAQSLLITPVVSGLPAAVSRMCARSDETARRRILRAGIGLSLLISIPLMLLGFLAGGRLANWLGSRQTLPALLVFLPCLPILGLSCALNGYCYGAGHPVPPALSEMLEQAVRFLLCFRLVSLFRGAPASLRAAIPAAGMLAGEMAGLLLMLLLAAGIIFRRPPSGGGHRRAVMPELIALALPLTGMRIVASLTRTVNAALLPQRLMLSGLSRSAAMSGLGMINGMMMPILLAPSFITCSLSMITAPELSRRQAQGRPLGRLIRRVLCAALGIALAAMAAVFAAAPLIARSLYRQPELQPLLRACCPLVPVMALCQVTGGMMNGLGLQACSLRISLASGLVSLLVTYLLAAQPGMRLWGAAAGLAAGHLLTAALNLRAIVAAVRVQAA